ncbi:hypothetical protein NQ318_023150 [Aromia moschata]|uniref:Phospholipase/carboxylesterase/thioesterase domain-containing protein n=1 Tax=Aromia moschata TaxID=1265417 RepID=A0AAV8WZV9_9CUCU|nr:hypothetical protein NQ318_023150 [Aromia moschata]
MAAPVVLAATAKHTATLIFLHGLGDTGMGKCDGCFEITTCKGNLSDSSYNAVTLNAGFRMPSWFDLKTLDESGPEGRARPHSHRIGPTKSVLTRIAVGSTKSCPSDRYDIKWSGDDTLAETSLRRWRYLLVSSKAGPRHCVYSVEEKKES